jgi:hypothetical protein
VVEIAEEQLVRDEAGLVPDHHRRLAYSLGDGLDVGDDGGIGDHRANDLDKFQHGRRVEEMHADDPGRMMRRHRDLGHRQRRGIRGQDRCLRDDGVEFGEDLPLQAEVFGDCLDDEVGVLEIGQRGGEGDPIEELFLLIFAEFAALDRAVGGVLQVAAAAGQPVVVLLDTDDAEAAASEDLRDAGTHRSQADHADRRELARHRLSCQRIVPICPSPCWTAVSVAQTVGGRSRQVRSRRLL